MWINWKTKTKIVGVLFLILVISNIILLGVFINFDIIELPHDADRISNGNTLIATTSYIEMLEQMHFRIEQEAIESNQSDHKIIEIDTHGNLLWEYVGLGRPHEIEELSNGHLLVADTDFDRIIQINYPHKEIVWSWEPAQINWTKLNPDWGSDHYYNNPRIYDWTYVNDVDIKDYGMWLGCLVSLRNFDLIVEINYTAELSCPNNPDNIIWWYGDYKNTTFQIRQHNPDYLSNGNVIVSDSGNNRIIEVNYSTKEIIWVYDYNLAWPRDADELENGNILITDSLGSRVIEINKETKNIIWEYSNGLSIPYESDALDNGNILISTNYYGYVIEVDKTGQIIWSYGFSYMRGIVYLNCIALLAISIVILYYKYRDIRISEMYHQRKFFHITVICSHVSLIIIYLLFIFFHTQFIAGVTKIRYDIFGVLTI